MYLFSVYAIFAALVASAVYRLYLHPLRKFPGPRLAAIAGWYAAYWDCFGQGGYTAHVIELHKQYGAHSWCHLYSG